MYLPSEVVNAGESGPPWADNHMTVNYCATVSICNVIGLGVINMRLSHMNTFSILYLLLMDLYIIALMVTPWILVAGIVLNCEC
jgi:hypothetical protein